MVLAQGWGGNTGEVEFCREMQVIGKKGPAATQRLTICVNIANPFSGFELNTHIVSLSIPLFREEPQLLLEHCLFCAVINSYPFSYLLSEARL